MRYLTIALGALLALLSRSREDWQPLAPGQGNEAIAGATMANLKEEPRSARQQEDPSGGYKPETSELVEWEGQPFLIDYGSDIVEVCPRPDPTLRFFAYTSIMLPNGDPYNIYRIRVTSTAYYRPMVETKWHFLETRQNINLDWHYVSLSWERSMPFAWEGRMKSEHGWMLGKGIPEAVRESEAGPVGASHATRLLP
ncbi:MAG: hypothetical protein H5U03_08185 [Clostridia bacterium]|nr:hypothetical protein [Calditrichota bacterium]MBC7345378.1 hypothetical protein [Clostridia bacterium]